MKAMMMLAVSFMVVSGSIAQAKISSNVTIPVEKLDPNIEENHIVDANMGKPCPNLSVRRSSGIQTAGLVAPAKATTQSKSVSQ